MKIPPPRASDDGTEAADEGDGESEVPLPQTLVRIPIEHASTVQQAAAGDDGTNDV